jgi:outer membrane receptor protein involved in Fe transport
MGLWRTTVACSLLPPVLVLAQEPDLAREAGVEHLERVVVVGRAEPLLGIATSASEGYVGRDHFEYRPLLRPGELLETVPGVIVTQHSGTGKANQYFARGFNLDHGTDFATSLDGVPINLPTHGHGQGYTDLNFVIPELVHSVHYRKGPYYADVGDFGSAGAANLSYATALDESLVQVEGGSFGYGRGVFLGGAPAGKGRLVYGMEVVHDDGPWQRTQDFQKANAVLRYSRGNDESGFRVTAMAYGGRWNSTDQIAQRAVDAGLIDRFGTLDPTAGGDSKRFSLNGAWQRESAGGRSEVQVYGVYYDLDLFSNFTYFLADEDQGDQFQQFDRRGYGGLQARHTWNHELSGLDSHTSVGFQTRGDLIENGLNSTRGRQVVSETRKDRIGQLSLAPYVEERTEWTDWLRTQAGVRVDYYRFDVDSSLTANSGERDDALASPKLGLVLGPWAQSEVYLNGGLGFHSNDGRGSTTRVDPGSGDPVDPVDPLVRTYGAETGIRTLWVPGLQSSLSVWWLDVDSELLFIGDAGTTEASRPSRRYGVEWANYYTPNRWWTLDADLSVSRSRFQDEDPVGRHIPGSIETVLAAGVTVHDPDPDRGAFASLRLRYFGPRALVEDDSVRSGETLLLNAEAGYRFSPRWTLSVQVFNLLNRRASDITYYYASRLRGEVIDPADPRYNAEEGGYNDLHFHPVEPLAARVALTARF